MIKKMELKSTKKPRSPTYKALVFQKFLSCSKRGIPFVHKTVIQNWDLGSRSTHQNLINNKGSEFSTDYIQEAGQSNTGNMHCESERSGF